MSCERCARRPLLRALPLGAESEPLEKLSLAFRWPEQRETSHLTETEAYT